MRITRWGRITETRFESSPLPTNRKKGAEGKPDHRKGAGWLKLRRRLTVQSNSLHWREKYRDCTEITDDMIRAFVERIIVHKTIRSAAGQKTRQSEVHLSFIGQFVLPPERESRTMNNSLFHHRQCVRFLLRVAFSYSNQWRKPERRFHGTEHPDDEDDPPLWPHGL